MKQAEIKVAGPVGSAFLRLMGFAGIVSPWRTVYVLADHADCAWLIRHEVAHLAQMDRDGWFKFWIGIVFSYFWFGYIHSPYEIEARQAEFNPLHPLLDGWDVGRAH